MRLRKIINNALTISLICFISTLSSNAQTKEDREAIKKLMQEEIEVFEDKRRPATQFDLGQIDLALSQKKYDVFYDIVLQVKADQNLQDFLEKKIHTGHIPLYWILAEINSVKKNGVDAHKWLYVATIMTEQDVHLCGDKRLTGFTKNILRNFPETIHYTRGTPYYIQEAMSQTYEFISNIKDRQTPEWICESLPQGRTGKKRTRAVGKGKWESVREKVLEEYAGKYKPKITSRDIFKELEEKEKREIELLQIEKAKENKSKQ